MIYKLDNGGVETSLCDGFGGVSSESQDVEWQCYMRSESRAWCLLCINIAGGRSAGEEVKVRV